MTLSKSDKDFWVEALTQDLLEEIERIAATPKGDIRVLAAVQAESEILAELGIAEKAEVAQQKEEEIQEVKAQLSKMEKEHRELTHELYETIEGTVFHNRHYAAYWEKALRDKAHERANNYLKRYGKQGAEVLRLQEAIKNLERTIRIMTSPTALREFLVSFSRKFNVNIGNNL